MKGYIFILFLSAFFINSKPSENDKFLKKNQQIATAFLETLSSGNVEGFISLFAENATYEEVASGRIYSNHQEIKMYIKSTLEGIPDSKFELQDMVINDKVLAIEWIWKGTNSVGWPNMGIPPTNRYFEIKGVSIMNVNDGLISSNRDYWDWNSFITKIGEE
jgi:steroid delta-isomerase-like uncharacterized protein